MFDGINRPTQQDSKPTSAAWSQPLTEVHSNTDVNANKTYHPVKPTKTKRSSLPILLGVLLLIVLGGGGYWWYTNYYNAEKEPVENNIVTTVEEKIVEEEIAEEEVALVFPGDYFLSGDELPEGFSAETKPENQDIEDLMFLYDDMGMEGIEELWALTYKKEGGNEQGLSVGILKYTSKDTLDIEIEKIKNTESTPFYNENGSVSFINKENILFMLASDHVDVGELDVLVAAFENKFKTTKIKVIWGQSSQEKLEYMSELTEKIFLCLIASESEYLDYFPRVDKYSQYYSLAENMDEDQKKTYVTDECAIIRREETDMDTFKQGLETDKDGDGLALYFEREYMTSDEMADTDGDGFDDLMEIESGYSPIGKVEDDQSGVLVDPLAIKTRNAQRQVDVNIILNAIYQYTIDNSGNLPESITDIEREICVSDLTSEDCGGLIWLGELLENEKYLISIPKDPGGDCSDNGACYTVMLDETERVTVSAPNAELGESIQVYK